MKSFHWIRPSTKITIFYALNCNFKFIIGSGDEQDIDDEQEQKNGKNIDEDNEEKHDEEDTNIDDEEDEEEREFIDDGRENMEHTDNDQDKFDIQEEDGHEEKEGASDEEGDMNNNHEKNETESVIQDPQGKWWKVKSIKSSSHSFLKIYPM